MPKGKGFYRPREVRTSYERDIGDPGEYPFTRGLYPEMYRARKPTIREFAGHGLAPVEPTQCNHGQTVRPEGAEHE